MGKGEGRGRQRREGDWRFCWSGDAWGGGVVVNGVRGGHVSFDWDSGGNGVLLGVAKSRGQGWGAKETRMVW